MILDLVSGLFTPAFGAGLGSSPSDTWASGSESIGSAADVCGNLGLGGTAGVYDDLGLGKTVGVCGDLGLEKTAGVCSTGETVAGTCKELEIGVKLSLSRSIKWVLELWGLTGVWG